MDTKTNLQFKELGITFIKVLIKNWRLVLVNATGLLGINLTLYLFVSALKMYTGKVPPEFYLCISGACLAYMAILIYKVLQLNGKFMIEKLKNCRYEGNNE